jgi:hypothetical protein
LRIVKYCGGQKPSDGFLFSNEFKGFALIEPSSLSASFSSGKVTCHDFSEAVANLPVALEVHFVSQMISSPRAAKIVPEAIA